MADGIRSGLDGVLRELSALYERLDEQQVERFAERLSADGGVFVAGAGRSGLLLRCFAMRLMHMGKKVHMIGDVTTPSARPGDLLLIGSGSGETGSLVMMAKKARALGVTVALITTNPASTIADMADVLVVLPGPTPKNVGEVDSAQSKQPMGSLFEQGMFLMLDCLIMRLMDRRGSTADAMFARHANLE